MPSVNKTCLLAFASVCCLSALGQTHKVQTHLLEPREHPDYARRAVQPPSWDTFGGKTRFTALRGFAIQDGQAVNYVEEIERYTQTFRLCDVIWPSYDLIFASNLGDVADEIKRRNLFLFDIWGYVPGSGPGGYWQQFHPDPAALALLEEKLGDHWLGMDIGEQDGRYIGGYAGQMFPISEDRCEQYLNFQRHFERMTTELGNKNSTLVSLNYGHYFLKEGVYTTIGAETAQGLPNGQVYYAFIRGAGKQYGVPWFGNASVWNRWGYKNYAAEGPDHGPTKGTSLSLLKRLLYSHILYNCMFVGFEAMWLNGDELTPVGRIQQAAVEWVETHGQPGVLQTPVALLLDFYSGWTFPRHLYTGNVYRVWGNLPYGPGDYLTDGVLNMLYPGYQDSSFYHDESGFMTPTPYGDSADCLLSDAPLWLLERYPTLIVAGGVSGGAELRDKLQAYAERGGDLVITAGNLATLPDGLAGVRADGPPVPMPAGTAVQGEPGDVAEPAPFVLHPLQLPAEAKVRARCGDMPAVVEVPCGEGRVTVLASAMGVGEAPAVAGLIRSDIDAPLAQPYPLLAHVRAVFDEALKKQVLFEAGEGLSLITCRKGAGDYTLGIANNGLAPLPFKIVSHCGPVEAIEELVLDQSEKSAVGYLPTGLEGKDVGASTADTIAGGDVRIFRVRVAEQGVVETPHVAPPPAPKGRLLRLGNVVSLKEAVLARPTFFEHYDGICIDWRYLHERESAALAAEAAWLGRQGLHIHVDLTSGINLYPDLRLIDNDPPEYAVSMEVIDGVLAKMPALNAHDLILSLHRFPENNFTGEQTIAAYDATLKTLCAKAAEKNITLHLRQSSKSVSLDGLLAMQDRVAAPNLRLALSTALLVDAGAQPQDVAAMRERVGLWTVSAAAYDVGGSPWTMQAPLADAPLREKAAALLTVLPEVPMLLDAACHDADAEYRDVRFVEEATSAR